MAKKYIIRWRGFGKFKHPIPEVVSTSSKKFKELVNSGAKIFGSKEEAKNHAESLKSRK